MNCKSIRKKLPVTASVGEQNWNVANDDQFEELLRMNLPDTPPDVIAYEVAPWRKSMNRILVGLVLCSITIQFLGLHYILPTIGILLLLLGFRGLRNENKWFKACWIFTILRLGIRFFSLIANATIYQVSIAESQVNQVLIAVATILLLTTCIGFWEGLRAIRKRTGVKFRTFAAGAVVWWYATMTILGLLQVNNILIALVYVVIFILLLYCLYKQSYQLDHAGYTIRPVSVKLSDGKLIGILLLVLFIGIGSGYAFGAKYQMDWQQVEATEHMQVEDVKAKLIQKGFPEDILNDMTAQDIAACENAIQIIVDEEPTYVEEQDDDRHLLEMISIIVELPDDNWKIIHHFRWKDSPGFAGSECVQTSTAYEAYSSGGVMVSNNILVSDYTGRVLYDKDGQRMQAPYHYLGERTYASHTMFMFDLETTDGFATFSMPQKGENHRGYFSYTVKQAREDVYISSWVNYIHQTRRWMYPVYTSEEYWKLGLRHSTTIYRPWWIEQQKLDYREEGGIVIP